MPETLETKVAVIANNQERLSSSFDDLTKSINQLVVTMTRRETEDKHRKEQHEKLDKKVTYLNEMVQSHKPIIEAYKESQDRKKKFYSAMSSTWAKLLAVVIVVGIGASLGIDTKLLGGK